MNHELRQALATLRLGDHICLFYDDTARQLETAVEFVRQGVERNELCVYVCSDRTCPDFSTALQRAGMPVTELVMTGALRVLDKSEAHLARNRFEPEKMIALLSAAVEQALDAGFNGLRVAGEMTWILDEAPGTDGVIGYEAVMNEFFSSARAVGLCQYNSRRLPEEIVEGAMRTHPRAILEGHVCSNPFYEPGEIFLKPAAGRRRVDWKLRQIAARRLN
jgi:two-component system, sensor histidine kinase PdtaS